MGFMSLLPSAEFADCGLTGAGNVSGQLCVQRARVVAGEMEGARTDVGAVAAMATPNGKEWGRVVLNAGDPDAHVTRPRIGDAETDDLL
jgi:hypothetical protein